MAHLAQHACQDGALVVLAAPADLAEAERAQRAAVPLALADLAPDLRDAHLRHQLLFLRPRRFFSLGAGSSGAGSSAAGGSAAAAGRRRFFSPSTVAFAMLIGFVVPRLLARMSRIPASSRTARTPPPAITPVPGLAGRSSTR